MQVLKVCCWTLKIWMIQLGLVVLIIQAQNCTKPEGPNLILSDAFINQQTFPDGGRVSFVCSTGYASAGGSKSITCTAGVWTKVIMKCEMVQCDPPPLIPNGERPYPDEETYKYQDVVQYTCKEGFTLNGSSSANCSENEEFQPSPPTCIKVSCPTPVV
ncbi:hypothetical protein DPEC_G00012170 [Dallia pectoralis]|uniref:Uncharacterized protein n=1 Tax=Dallia pectoralis TaxID=75939 RepID=A0ACC2HMC9_DALPE|nr:hypothetical protein DPEC_G00012170 [Dallia pectoralis]